MQYRLRMDIRIESVDERGHMVANQGLVIGQDITFEAADFMQVAYTIGQFHELAEKIRGSGSATQ